MRTIELALYAASAPLGAGDDASGSDVRDAATAAVDSGQAQVTLLTATVSG